MSDIFLWIKRQDSQSIQSVEVKNHDAWFPLSLTKLPKFKTFKHVFNGHKLKKKDKNVADESDKKKNQYS